MLLEPSPLNDGGMNGTSDLGFGDLEFRKCSRDTEVLYCKVKHAKGVDVKVSLILCRYPKFTRKCDFIFLRASAAEILV